MTPTTPQRASSATSAPTSPRTNGTSSRNSWTVPSRRSKTARTATEPRLARYPTQVLRPGDTHPATRLARPTRGGHPGTPHDQLSRPDEYGPLDQRPPPVPLLHYPGVALLLDSGAGMLPAVAVVVLTC